MFARSLRLLVPLVLVSLALTAAPPAARAAILLNEVLADPARDWNADGVVSSRDDEWLEVINTGPGVADLAGFRLAGPDTVWRYEFSGLLGPGQIRLVTGKEAYQWETAHAFPAFGLRLSNTGGEIFLFRVVGTTITMADCYAYTDHEADDDRSSGRAPDGGPNWLLFDGYNPWTGTAEPLGSGCFPTPGSPITCPTPVEPTTWSRVKSLLHE